MLTGKNENRKKTSLSANILARQKAGLFPVISEIKVRSEKEGDLLCGRNPVALAKKMAACPVAGISVVTEPHHFGGSMDLLRDITSAIDLPVLHKDFISHESQVEESAACGAQAILLIAARLEVEDLKRLIDRARKCGLETLVEVHSLSELKKVEPLPYDMLGINNRDITIFEVDDTDVGKTEELAPWVKDHRIWISESAIGSEKDVLRAARSGAHAVLVGTAVLKAENIADFLMRLISVGWPV
ncbi:MAG TPA: indole-3-glycerol-phosphate synthase [Syntrophales bacterium]|nr:indole-3-glycerol-phosphate synthase [Syntrophales bacterium]HOL60204.1 indole-3-glycerol-phosphate synthase [Syntrophales bacterium]